MLAAETASATSSFSLTNENESIGQSTDRGGAETARAAAAGALGAVFSGAAGSRDSRRFRCVRAAFDVRGTARGFAEVMRGVAEPEGIDRAINRIAQRARQPDALLAACGNWRAHGAELAPGLAEVLRDCLRA